MPQIERKKISTFGGLNTKIKDTKTLPRGVSPDSLNWLVGEEKDNIALRRGVERLGTTDGGTGKVTGIAIGSLNPTGERIPFFTHGRKLKYYDADADDVAEVGSDLLPAAASGEDVSVNAYSNLAGSFIYLSSPNSSVYKVHIANPGSAVDQATTNYKGIFHFAQSRLFLFQRYGTNNSKDLTNVYLSYIDKISLSDYPQTTAEAVGSSGSTHYTHTLVAVTGVKTAFQLVVSATTGAGTETFTDNGDGTLTSNFDGTGTVNYSTGAIVVDFANTTTGAVTCSYYTEDATDEGVLDFDYNVAARVAGTGNLFTQFSGGGKLMHIANIGNVFVCIHEFKTWQLTIPTDDGGFEGSLPTNLPYREQMGISYSRGACGASDGVYLINTASPESTEVIRIVPYQGSAEANTLIPEVLSNSLDLSVFDYSFAPVFEWGDYVIFSCAQIRNGVADNVNSRTFLYHKLSKVWNLTDLPATAFANYNGLLLAADPLENNVYRLFTGFADQDSLIYNYWTSGRDDLDWTGKKKVKRMLIEGLIQTTQQVEVSISLNGGSFVTVFTIDGSGEYVDTGTSISIGNNMFGSKVIGGGGGTTSANPFSVEFPINTRTFEDIRIKFEAISGGYVQINSYEWLDIRYVSYKSSSPHLS